MGEFWILTLFKIAAGAFTSQGIVDSPTWDSEPTRQYHILDGTNLTTVTWQGSPLGIDCAIGRLDHNRRFHTRYECSSRPIFPRGSHPASAGTLAVTMRLVLSNGTEIVVTVRLDHSNCLPSSDASQR